MARKPPLSCRVGGFNRLKGGQTGRALIEALQASPHREIDLETAPVRPPVRDVVL
jgi:hypothetical protein